MPGGQHFSLEHGIYPLLNLAGRPRLPLAPHFHGREAPVEAVVMPTLREAGPRARLLVVQHRQHTEDDRHACVEPDPHQPVHCGLGNVFEVHRLAFDQHAHGDDGVKGSVGLRRSREGREIRRRGSEEVARRDGSSASRALDLRCREESVEKGRVLE